MDAAEQNSPETVRPVALRYHTELSQIEGCPGPRGAFDGPGYCMVHESLQHPENFVPKAVLDPGRLQTASSCKYRCALWGLSMFESLEQLKKHITRVERTTRNFRKLVGGYYAELHLKPSDGVRTTSSNSGHFDLHPSTSFVPKECVRAHEVLQP